MKAVGYFKPQDIGQADSLADLEVAKPVPGPDDLLVAVRAVSVNPVDYKVRQSRAAEGNTPVVLGWDAAGIVEDFGSAVQGFKKGEPVYYAGDLTRPGSNAEFQTVDHRLVGRKPQSLNFAQAAALPLTSLTAYEALFEQLRLPQTGPFNILVIGGAGGVGSMAVQLVKTLTQGRVYATAGRGVSKDWVSALGADGVIDRAEPIEKEMARLGVKQFDYVFSTTHTDEYLETFPSIVRPFGVICLIDDPQSFDIASLKNKSISVAWELMFTKSLYGYDRESQGRILDHVASLVDAGRVRSTAKTALQGLKASNFREAHRQLESGGGVGKIVVNF